MHLIGYQISKTVANRNLAAFLLPLALSALAGCATLDDADDTPTGAALASDQPELGLQVRSALSRDGFRFRDANGDGILAPYEDWRLPPEQRVADLVARMNDAEKVGTLMHGTLPGRDGVVGAASAYDLEQTSDFINSRHITSFITRLALEPAELAEQNNSVQILAAGARLGIPVTISTDPRNHFSYVLGASSSAAGNTKWPELTGFAALRDPARVRQFGEIARREYRALGIHMALSPQLDLFTEPRWARGNGTFGSDPQLTSALGAAYVAGFQGADHGLTRDGVITVVKHWVGYGAQPEGFDGHNYYGRFARPGDKLESHVEAFRGALESGAGAVMPAYPILVDARLDGTAIEASSPGYNQQLLGEVLRGEMGFDGFVLSDWAITRDCNERCRAPTEEAPQRPQDISTAWGVEDLTVRERYVKGLTAGLDQFGGTEDVDPLREAVAAGEVSQNRLDQAVSRILLPKFVLGLFENPYVDPAKAERAAGSEADYALAERTQREAQVLLRNEGNALPFTEGAKVWLFGMDPQAAREAGLEVVEQPAQADFAIVRTETPSQMLHPNHFFGSRYKEGRLDFRPGDPAYDALVNASAHVPVILAIFLDRAAILTQVQDMTDVILANFGASDAAVLDVALGKAQPRGSLPFELPRSMAAVDAQDPGISDDSGDPLYAFGAGL